MYISCAVIYYLHTHMSRSNQAAVWKISLSNGVIAHETLSDIMEQNRKETLLWLTVDWNLEEVVIGRKSKPSPPWKIRIFFPNPRTQVAACPPNIKRDALEITIITCLEFCPRIYSQQQDSIQSRALNKTKARHMSRSQHPHRMIHSPSFIFSWGYEVFSPIVIVPSPPPIPPLPKIHR